MKFIDDVEDIIDVLNLDRSNLRTISVAVHIPEQHTREQVQLRQRMAMRLSKTKPSTKRRSARIYYVDKWRK